jgi:DeoR/GlpR family transcriptional regulator of sugar metabolism
MCLGGAYDPVCNACFGIVTEQSITRLRVDLALLSAAAIRGSRAYFHNPDVVRFKLACLSAAERSVLMVDHTKFSKLALHMFTHLDAFDEVVTTDLLDPRDAEALREDRVRLTLVPFVQPNGEAAKHNEKLLSGGRRG